MSWPTRISHWEQILTLPNTGFFHMQAFNKSLRFSSKFFNSIGLMDSSLHIKRL